MLERRRPCCSHAAAGSEPRGREEYGEFISCGQSASAEHSPIPGTDFTPPGDREVIDAAVRNKAANTFNIFLLFIANKDQEVKVRPTFFGIFNLTFQDVLT